MDGPAFVTVMVKSTLAPTATEPLLAIFATPTSAREVSVVTSDAESLPVLTSPPPETEAVLVSGLDTDWPTAMVTVIAGYVALALSASDRVQVTSWAATPQVQPVPDALEGVRPDGNVSVTVTAPLVDADPRLLTTML